MAPLLACVLHLMLHAVASATASRQQAHSASAAPPSPQPRTPQASALVEPRAMDPCGKALLNVTFSEYTGTYRPYTQAEARSDFAAGAVTRPSAAGVDLVSGITGGHGYEHAQVGNGSLMVTHAAGTLNAMQCVLRSTLSKCGGCLRLRRCASWCWTRATELVTDTEAAAVSSRHMSKLRRLPGRVHCRLRHCLQRAAAGGCGVRHAVFSVQVLRQVRVDVWGQDAWTVR